MSNDPNYPQPPQPEPVLPFGVTTIQAGALRSMTHDKLATFSLGTTKKTAFQKHKEALEAKRKQQELEAQAELSQWVEQFEGSDKPKAFVRGGVMGGDRGSGSSSGGGGGGGGRSGGGGGNTKRPSQPSAAAQSMFGVPDDGVESPAAAAATTRSSLLLRSPPHARSLARSLARLLPRRPPAPSPRHCPLTVLPMHPPSYTIAAPSALTRRHRRREHRWCSAPSWPSAGCGQEARRPTDPAASGQQRTLLGRPPLHPGRHEEGDQALSDGFLHGGASARAGGEGARRSALARPR